MEHYLNTQEGAIYGLDHYNERFLPKEASLLRPDSGISGLKTKNNFCIKAVICIYFFIII